MGVGKAKEIVVQLRKLQHLQQRQRELKRLQEVDSKRVKKIFENQERLRENIKSMEHVRTGNLLDRYMNDMDKEENDLISTRQRIEEAEEQIAASSQAAQKVSFQVSMDAKKIQKRCSFN